MLCLSGFKLYSRRVPLTVSPFSYMSIFSSFNHVHFSYKDIPLYMVDLDRLSEKPSIYIYISSLKR